MPTSIATIQINAPATDVYRYVSTPHLLHTWIGGLRPDGRIGGDSEIKLGMRAQDHSSKKVITPESEIVSFEPDHSVSMRIESAGFIMHSRFHLFESDGVTTVRQSVKLTYKRWYRLFVMITNRSVQKRISESLGRLKKLLEDEEYRLNKPA